MNIAIDEAKKATDIVYPNPKVGCIIVQNGEIVSSGYHNKFGGPHAEVEAINNCNITLDKATTDEIKDKTVIGKRPVRRWKYRHYPGMVDDKSELPSEISKKNATSPKINGTNETTSTEDRTTSDGKDGEKQTRKKASLTTQEIFLFIIGPILTCVLFLVLVFFF